ncbi:MAG TPA: copper homeostasis membrane protein CopD [Myxococcota bacterium]|nr:copper homeostasis membrane protein CopD [Myxococcota bacterium]
MNAPLIATRWIHFASAVALVGVFSFRLFVGDPAFQLAVRVGYPVDHQRLARRLRGIASSALLLTFFSGLLWLVLQACVMSGRSLSEVLFGGVVATVVLRTQVGHVWLGRTFVLAFLVFVLVLLSRRRWEHSRAPLALAFALAAADLSALVWAGHAGAARGARGALEQTADAVHLLAVGIWLGGLVPLALLLAAARSASDRGWLMVARSAVARFSTLGVLSISSILATGVISSIFLVGNPAGLWTTNYGRCLLLKLGLFAATVGVASMNRVRLVPLISSAPTAHEFEPAWRTIRALQRNTAIEVGLGLLILGVVGVLGTLPPATHQHVHDAGRAAESHGSLP